MSGLLFVVSAASEQAKHPSLKHYLNVSTIFMFLFLIRHAVNDLANSMVCITTSTKEDFLNLVNEGGFIEYAEVFGNYYGTAQATVKEQLAKGHDVLLEIDWQGAQQVRRLFP